MKRVKIFWILLTLIVFVNLPLWDLFIGRDYTYSNIDGSFTYQENTGKGSGYISAERSYTSFLCQHPDKDKGNNNLYRTFTIQPWRFWEWRQMIFHSDRFFLPYKAP
jgi:hypothetical protein